MSEHPEHPKKKKINLFQVFEPSPHLSLDLTADDLNEQLAGEKTSELFLGHFEKTRIMNALDNFGILRELTGRGYPDIHLELQARGPHEHFLRLYDQSREKRELLSEIILKEGRYVPAAIPGLDMTVCPVMDVLCIEWILMQDFRGAFQAGRRRLPGQNHPGLGVGQQVVHLLDWVANLLQKDALLNMPEYFHNAVFYDRWFKFVDPCRQGEMTAIVRDLSLAGYDIVDMSHAALFNCLIDRRTALPFHWEGGEQIQPITGPVKYFFTSQGYWQIAKQRSAALSITVDERRFTEKMKDIDQVVW